MQSTEAVLRRRTVGRVPDELVPRLTPTNKTDEKKDLCRFQEIASQADDSSLRPQLALAAGLHFSSNAPGDGGLLGVGCDWSALRQPLGAATKGPLVSRLRRKS